MLVYPCAVQDFVADDDEVESIHNKSFRFEQAVVGKERLCGHKIRFFRRPKLDYLPYL